MGLKGKPIAVILLNEHSIKMAPNGILLYMWKNVFLNLSWGTFLSVDNSSRREAQLVNVQTERIRSAQP